MTNSALSTLFVTIDLLDSDSEDSRHLRSHLFEVTAAEPDDALGLRFALVDGELELAPWDDSLGDGWVLSHLDRHDEGIDEGHDLNRAPVRLKLAYAYYLWSEHPESNQVYFLRIIVWPRKSSAESHCRSE